MDNKIIQDETSVDPGYQKAELGTANSREGASTRI